MTENAVSKPLNSPEAVAGELVPDPERTAIVNRYVRRMLVLFLGLVVVGWLPVLPFLHLSQTRSPIFEKERRMGDLFNATKQMQHFSALTIGPTFNYPAPAAFVVAFFLQTNHPKIYFVLSVIVALAIAVLLLWLALLHSGSAGFCLYWRWPAFFAASICRWRFCLDWRFA